MGFLKEFKTFALKGNVMDMAVGVIIGGAFGKIVTSLVNDIIMPPVGVLIGNTNFTDLKVDISHVKNAISTVHEHVSTAVSNGVDMVTNAADQAVEVVETVVEVPVAEPVYWCYGKFIQECIDFTILAFCVFLMVKLMNKLMKKEEAAAPAPAPAPEPEPTAEEKLLTEIRDLLKAQKEA